MNLASRYSDAWHAFSLIEEEVFDFARSLFDLASDVYPFDRVGVDDCDWEGTSLELKGCQSELKATDQMAEKAYSEGFDVLDLDYGNRVYKRWYSEATKIRHREFRLKWELNRDFID